MDKLIKISGTITCEPDDLDLVLKMLPDHIALSRGEPGCLAFSITQSDDDPCIFNVSERFQDRAAFDAHSERTRASGWWAETCHIPRNLTITGA